MRSDRDKVTERPVNPACVSVFHMTIRAVEIHWSSVSNAAYSPVG